mmetsp:Transcript_160631/g.283226  ORF Transcript_160631/g.283226 Transcript_160631/m.283226 type:complete len:424 (-) Transcript_160631:79-1350(-)
MRTFILALSFLACSGHGWSPNPSVHSGLNACNFHSSADFELKNIGPVGLLHPLKALVVLLLAFDAPASGFQFIGKNCCVVKGNHQVSCRSSPLSSHYNRHAPALASTSSSSSADIVVLDFDGVICDSEPELTRSAWRAGQKMWPDYMKTAAALDIKDAGVRRAWVGGDWSVLEGIGEDGLPNWLKYKMRQLRPVVESKDSSVDALLLLRLCVGEAIACAKNWPTGSRPLTVGEIVVGWDKCIREAMLMRCEVEDRPIDWKEAVEVLRFVRNAWPENEPDSWLAAHTLHDGAVNALRTAISQGEDVYILSCKQRCLIQALLEKHDIHLEDKRILELESTSKAETLSKLALRHPHSQLKFVEDRADTVLSLCNDLSIFGVRLYFAEWGYSTDSQKHCLRGSPRVCSLEHSKELSKVFSKVSEKSV